MLIKKQIVALCWTLKTSVDLNSVIIGLGYCIQRTSKPLNVVDLHCWVRFPGVPAISKMS
jgi:hypothetical protein